jgi:hypothetical protein
VVTTNHSVIAAWKQEFTPKSVKVEVLFDGDLASRLKEAESEAAQSNGMLAAPDKVEKLLDALKAEAREKTHTLIFKTVGRKRWRDLLSEHPPTEEQRRASPMTDFNHETFPAAAMALSCDEPKLTIEDAQWMLDTLDVGDADKVWAACLDANITGVSVPKAATATARRGGRKLTPQSS